MLSIVAPTVQPQVEPNCRCLDTGTGIRTIYIRQNFSALLFFSYHNDRIKYDHYSSSPAPTFKPLCHFVYDEMDPNERKPRDGKRYEFPVHSERTRALAAAMDTTYAQGPPQGYTPSRSVFPASNAYAVEPIPYPSQLMAPPAHSRMDVDTQVSTEEERRWNREQERRNWQQYCPPSPQYQTSRILKNATSSLYRKIEGRRSEEPSPSSARRRSCSSPRGKRTASKPTQTRRI
jgi:hypothetical protein